MSNLPEARLVTIEDLPKMQTAIRQYLSEITLSYAEREARGQIHKPSLPIPVKISGVLFDARVMALTTNPHGRDGAVSQVALVVESEHGLGGDGPQSVILCQDDRHYAASLELPYGEQAFSPVGDIQTYPDYWSIPEPPMLFQRPEA